MIDDFIFSCNTLLCVRNQLAHIGPDDMFVIGYLGIGTIILVYLIVESVVSKY
jgi:hypothetical protein